MINVSIAGIGGQGSVLAAKILAQAAQSKGWQVRSAETKGMAQRGGNVMSHVRMGNLGEEVFSPLPALASVDVLIALEPGEGARALPYLKKGGLLVSTSSGVMPVMTNAKAAPYKPEEVLKELREKGVDLLVVNDEELVRQVGNPKTRNIIMLAYAIYAVNNKESCKDNALRGELSLDDIVAVFPQCMKQKQIADNEKAVKIVSQRAKV